MLQGDRQKTAAAKIKTPMYESPVPRPDGIDAAAAFLQSRISIYRSWLLTT